GRGREHGLSSSASSTPSEATRRASSASSLAMATPNRAASAAAAPAPTPAAAAAASAQPPSRMWQPSYGPGSPQTPVADIVRGSNNSARVSTNGKGPSSGKVLGKPTAGQAAAIAAAAERAFPGPNARRVTDG
ncbi:unnamed protein product, partial [Laminaria digitata]